MAKLTFSNYGDEMLSPHQKLQEQAKYLVAQVQGQLNNYKSHRNGQAWQTLGVELVINPETWAELREVDHPQVGVYPNRLCGQPVIQSYDLPTGQVRVLLSAGDPQLTKAKNSGWVSAGGGSTYGNGTVSITASSNNTWSVANGSPPGHGIGGGGGGGHVPFDGTIEKISNTIDKIIPGPGSHLQPGSVHKVDFFINDSMPGNESDHLLLSETSNDGHVSVYDLGSGPPQLIKESMEQSTYEVFTQNGQTWKFTAEAYYKLLKACDKAGWKVSAYGYGSLDETVKKQLDSKLQGKTKKQLNAEIKEKLKADSKPQTWITNPTTGEMKQLPYGAKTPPGWLETVMPEPKATLKPDMLAKPENIVQFGEFQIGPIHSVPKPEPTLLHHDDFVISKMASTGTTNQLAAEISKMKDEINTLLVAKQDSEAALNELQATIAAKKSISDDIWQKTKAKQNGKTTASKKAMVGQITPAGVITEYNPLEDSYTLLVGGNSNKSYSVKADDLKPLVTQVAKLPKISAEDIYEAVKATGGTFIPAEVLPKKGSKKSIGGESAFQSLLDEYPPLHVKTWLPGDSPYGDEDEAVDGDEEPPW